MCLDVSLNANRERFTISQYLHQILLFVRPVPAFILPLRSDALSSFVYVDKLTMHSKSKSNAKPGSLKVFNISLPLLLTLGSLQVEKLIIQLSF